MQTASAEAQGSPNNTAVLLKQCGIDKTTLLCCVSVIPLQDGWRSKDTLTICTAPLDRRVVRLGSQHTLVVLRDSVL